MTSKLRRKSGPRLTAEAPRVLSLRVPVSPGERAAIQHMAAQLNVPLAALVRSVCRRTVTEFIAELGETTNDVERAEVLDAWRQAVAQ